MRYEEIQLEQAALNPPDGWASLRMPGAFVPGLVSVIVPAYNRAMFIADAIESILSQTYRPVELLVVDDGSSDATAQIVRSKFAATPEDSGFSAIFIRQPNRGASAARNQGLLHSKGEFIQYLDSDDVLVRHKLDSHVRALQSDEVLDIVWSGWQVLPTDQLPAALIEANQVDSSSAPNSMRPTQQTMPWEPWPTLTRRRFLAPHPLWNEHVSRWDDWEYALRLMAAGPKCARSDDIGCIQREHDQGRRYDFDFNPAGVEVGLIACREAAGAAAQHARKSRDLAQLVANRYWEVGIEAVSRGTAAQACEAFRVAASTGIRLPFRVKAFASWLGLKMGRGRLTRRLLAGRVVESPVST